MEYIIIFILIIIIFILYYLKQINFIKTLINIKHNKHNNHNNIFKVSYIYKYKLLYYNPILINLYELILKDIKYYNIYNYKSYIVFSNLKLSSHDIILLDWFGFINGIIKLSIDTITKLLKKNINHQILKSFGDNIKSLKLYYHTMYIKFNNNKYINKQIQKYINTHIKHKKLKNNIILQDLYYIYYVQKQLFQEIVNFSKKNNDIYLKIVHYLKKNKDIYLLNSTLNNKLSNITTNNKHNFKLLLDK
jgi:hypothetical protein